MLVESDLVLYRILVEPIYSMAQEFLKKVSGEIWFDYRVFFIASAYYQGCKSGSVVSKSTTKEKGVNARLSELGFILPEIFRPVTPYVNIGQS